MAPPCHKPTAETRRQVETFSGVGLPHEQIAMLLDIDDKTLRKHYRRELDVGSAKATATVAQTLFKQATGGNTAAMIFWMKARAGWREKQEVALTDANGGPVRMIIEERIVDPRGDDRD